MSVGRHAAATPSRPLWIQDRFDFDHGLLWLDIRNDGSDEAVFHLYNGLAASPEAHRYRLNAGKTLSLSWPASPYDLHIVAPDGLYRRFAGRLADDGATTARLAPARRGAGLILGLSSAEAAWFCVLDETAGRVVRRSRVRVGDRPHLRVPLEPGGWYDLSVSRVGGPFHRRFAGRVALPRNSGPPARSFG
ncbi:phospholipase domain-containing protein [Brevundimonas sp. R86498]|uniref:phospholipase domain-containing protein n=1 Tax=Brevundimonas sp. R86498 TaxID=3093845 RepID=UPI0037C865F4